MYDVLIPALKCLITVEIAEAGSVFLKRIKISLVPKTCSKKEETRELALKKTYSETCSENCSKILSENLQCAARFCNGAQSAIFLVCA